MMRLGTVTVYDQTEAAQYHEVPYDQLSEDEAQAMVELVLEGLTRLVRDQSPIRETFELSGRAENVLARNGIRTVADLHAYERAILPGGGLMVFRELERECLRHAVPIPAFISTMLAKLRKQRPGGLP